MRHHGHDLVASLPTGMPVQLQPVLMPVWLALVGAVAAPVPAAAAPSDGFETDPGIFFLGRDQIVVDSVVN
jgi:hypothetical protein